MRRFCPKYESTIPFRVSRKWNFEILWNPWNHGRFGSQMITQKLHSTLLGTTDLTYHKSRARHEMSSSWNKILNSTSHNVSESDLTYHYVGRLCRNHSLSFNITSNQHKKRLTIGVHRNPDLVFAKMVLSRLLEHLSTQDFSVRQVFIDFLFQQNYHVVSKVLDHHWKCASNV